MALTDKEKQHIEVGCALEGLGERIQEELTAAGAVEAGEIADGAVDTDQLAADAVTGAKIEDDAVSSEHLDDGILPSHVVKFAGEFTTAGGDASEIISVSGMLATDLAFVMLKTEGSSPVTVDAAAAANDQIDVTMSADPSNDHVLVYQVLRAVS